MSNLPYPTWRWRHLSRIVPPEVQHELDEGMYDDPDDPSVPGWRNRWNLTDTPAATPQTRVHRTHRTIKFLEVPAKMHRELGRLADTEGYSISRYVMKVLYDHLVASGVDCTDIHDLVFTPHAMGRVRNARERAAFQASQRSGRP